MDYGVGEPEMGKPGAKLEDQSEEEKPGRSKRKSKEERFRRETKIRESEMACCNREPEAKLEPEAGKAEAKGEDQSNPEMSKRKSKEESGEEESEYEKVERSKRMCKEESEFEKPELEEKKAITPRRKRYVRKEMKELGDGHYLEGAVIYYFGDSMPDKDLIKETFKGRRVMYLINTGPQKPERYYFWDRMYEWLDNVDEDPKIVDPVDEVPVPVDQDSEDEDSEDEVPVPAYQDSEDSDSENEE